MNSKQAKRLRKSTNAHIQTYLGNPDISVKDRSLDRFLVESKTYNAQVTGQDGTVTEHKDKAVQVRLTIGSPRQVYKEVKKRIALRRKQSRIHGVNSDVQANRAKKRGRVLRSIRVRREEAIGAVEHAGTAGVQP